jgi:hypothetical protein
VIPAARRNSVKRSANGSIISSSIGAYPVKTRMSATEPAIRMIGLPQHSRRAAIELSFGISDDRWPARLGASMAAAAGGRLDGVAARS